MTEFQYLDVLFPTLRGQQCFSVFKALHDRFQELKFEINPDHTAE